MLPVPGFRFLPRAGGSKSCPSVHSICWATLQGWAVPVGGMGGLHKMAHQPMITIFTTEHLYPTPKQPAQTCPAPCPICSVHTPRPSISVPLVAVCQREFAVMRPDTASQLPKVPQFFQAPVCWERREIPDFHAPSPRVWPGYEPALCTRQHHNRT